MRISISGKNLEISSYMREVAEKKLSKLDRYFPQDTEAQVTLSVEKNRHIVEVTIPHSGRVIRGEETSTDMYASLDNVLDKLEKQIVHNRTRLEKTLRENAFSDLPYEEDDEEELLDFEVMHEVFVELKAGLEGKLTYAGNRFIKFKWEK